MDAPSQLETLGQRIRRLRLERNFSQTRLAKELEVTNSWISQVENGTVNPSQTLLRNMARLFKVPIQELLLDEEDQMEVASRLKLVSVLLENGQSIEAEGILQGVCNHPVLTKDEQMRVAMYLAECQYQQKRYEESVGSLLPLITRLEADNYHDAQTMAWMRNLIGSAYFEKQDFTNANYNFRKAYDYTLRFVAFDSLAAKISYNVGMTLRKCGRNQDSIYYLDCSHRFFQANHDLKRLAHTIFEQGISYKNCKDYARASECFDQAKAIYHGLNLKYSATLVQVVVASTITAKINPDQALQQLQECADMFRAESDIAGLVDVHTNRGIVFLQLEEFEHSYHELQVAYELTLKHSLHDTPESGKCYRALAKYHSVLRNYSQSNECALKSSEIFDTIGLIRDQIESMQIAIDNYQAAHDLEPALKLSKRCNELWKSLHEEGGL